MFWVTDGPVRPDVPAAAQPTRYPLGGLQPAPALAKQPLEAVVASVVDRCNRQFTFEFLETQRVDRFAVSVQRPPGLGVDARLNIGHVVAITATAGTQSKEGIP